MVKLNDRRFGGQICSWRCQVVGHVMAMWFYVVAQWAEMWWISGWRCGAQVVGYVVAKWVEMWCMDK